MPQLPDIPYTGPKQPELPDIPYTCPAVIHTGPGHQSKHRCTRRDPHPLEGEHYVTEVVHEWTGPEAYAEYWG